MSKSNDWVQPLVGLLAIFLFMGSCGVVGHLIDESQKKDAQRVMQENARKAEENPKNSRGGGCDPQSVSPCGQPDTNFTPPSAPNQ